MNIKSILAVVAMLGLAACATAPQQRFARSVEAAQAANRPLVVYRFEGMRVAERVPFRSVQKFDTYVGVGIINTAQQPIQKLVFKVADYRGSQPMMTLNSEPVEGALTAIGPFAPGSSFTFATKAPIWTTTVASNDSCPRITGIEVVYQDGSNLEVSAQNVPQYLAPQINVNCANYNRNYQYHEVFGTADAAGYVPGSQGNPDVTHGISGP